MTEYLRARVAELEELNTRLRLQLEGMTGERDSEREIAQGWERNAEAAVAANTPLCHWIHDALPALTNARELAAGLTEGREPPFPAARYRVLHEQCEYSIKRYPLGYDGRPMDPAVTGTTSDSGALKEKNTPHKIALRSAVDALREIVLSGVGNVGLRSFREHARHAIAQWLGVPRSASWDALRGLLPTDADGAVTGTASDNAPIRQPEPNP